jgi:thiol-disulfide isomerase/thioredoxin
MNPLNSLNRFSSSTRILLIVFIFVLIAVVLYFVVSYFQKKVNYNDNGTVQEGSTAHGKEAEIMLFSVDWCPHCKTAKPEWDKVKSEYNGKKKDGYTVVFTEINCTNETPQVEKMMNQYKIEGYPTIKMIKDGQVIEFDAKPTAPNITQFIQTVL